MVEHMRSVSNPLDSAAASDMLRQPLPPIPTASSAQQFSSSHPHEPSISEETSNYVGRSVSQSAQSPSRQRTTSRGATQQSPAQQQQQQQQQHAAAAAALAPVNTSTGSSYTTTQATSKRRQYRQVGDWILQKTLGQGSMGKVKLGVNVHTQEKVSILGVLNGF
jgi:hypothetical protein